MDEVEKAINDYQKGIVTKNFIAKLESVAEEAKTKKNTEPKSEETRHWAVIYTDLEKTLAYAKTYLSH